MKKRFILLLVIVWCFGFGVARICQPSPVLAEESLARKLVGKILLAVEDRGKTFYVSEDGYRYQVTVETARAIFEKLALGITNENLEKIPLKNFELEVYTTDQETATEEKPFSPAPNQAWLDEQAEGEKEFPVILSMSDNKGNVNAESTFYYYRCNKDNYSVFKGCATTISGQTPPTLKVGDQVTWTVNAQDPKGRQILYAWESELQCENVNSMYEEKVFSPYNSVTCTVTKDDNSRIFIYAYIKVANDNYRNPSGFDDSISIVYEVK